MANETFLSLQARFSKNGLRLEASKTFNKDVTGADAIHKTQNIGTTAETVDFGDITGAPKTVMIANLDATNFVEIGGDSGLTVFKLAIDPGEFIVLNLASATLYAKADTASCLIEILAVEA